MSLFLGNHHLPCTVYYHKKREAAIIYFKKIPTKNAVSKRTKGGGESRHSLFCGKKTSYHCCCFGCVSLVLVAVRVRKGECTLHTLLSRWPGSLLSHRKERTVFIDGKHYKSSKISSLKSPYKIIFEYLLTQGGKPETSYSLCVQPKRG